MIVGSEEHKAHRRARYAELNKVPEIREKFRLQRKYWIERNPEKKKASDLNWRSKNYSRCKANSKAWVLRNKNKDSDSHKQSYFKHRANRLKYRKKYYQENKVVHLRKQKEYREKNPQIGIARYKRHYRNNVAHYKAKELARRALRKKATVNTAGIKKFVTGTKSKEFVICYYCENKTPSFGCNFDHIVPLSKGGSHSVGNLCVTCPTCNKSKGPKRVHDWIKFGQLVFSI